jgi:hypothetical protein
MNSSALAVACGVKTKVVRGWEKDEAYPDSSVMPVLSRVLGYSEEYLNRFVRIIKEYCIECDATIPHHYPHCKGVAD